MATLTLQKVGDGLGDVQFGAASAGGDECPAGVELGGWSLPVLLLVQNDSGTLATDVTVGALPAVTVPIGGRAAIQVNSGNNLGTLVPVTYTEVTSVTVAAVDLAPAA